MLTEILIKYTDKPAPPGGTIAAHLAIINKLGYVWFGKFGKRISEPSQEQILSQLHDQQIFSYLVKKNRSLHKVYGLLTLDIRFQPPVSNEYPDYYSSKNVGLWIKTNTIVELKPSVLYHLIGKSSRVPITATMNESQASLLFVCRKPSPSIEEEFGV